MSTLGGSGGAIITLRVVAGVSTLGADSGVDGGVVMIGRSGGCWMVEKMARRLSMARSQSSVLVGERSARIAVVSALRQWMMRSLVVKAGRVSV
jgi:hypothetical protein